MPDGTVFVASGSINGLNPAVYSNNNPTYEILDRNGVSNGRSIPMDILTKNQPYYMVCKQPTGFLAALIYIVSVCSSAEGW